MIVGKRDFQQIMKDYTMIDFEIVDTEIWALFEHNEDGDEVESIAINLTKKYYTYTWESLQYTVEYLDDEFELYSLS